MAIRKNFRIESKHGAIRLLDANPNGQTRATRLDFCPKGPIRQGCGPKHRIQGRADLRGH
jgi:hypothetical protein